MKSLLKLSIVCLISFVITNTTQAQCITPQMQTPTISHQDAISVTYRYTVTTPTIVDRIVLNAGRTCYNTSSCTGSTRKLKKCNTQYLILSCQTVNNSCTKQEGCIVVIDPLSSGCN